MMRDEIMVGLRNMIIGLYAQIDMVYSSWQGVIEWEFHRDAHCDRCGRQD